MYSLQRQQHETIGYNLFILMNDMENILPPHDIMECIHENIQSYTQLDQARIYGILRRHIQQHYVINRYTS